MEGLANMSAKTVVGIWDDTSFTRGVFTELPGLEKEFGLTIMEVIECTGRSTAENFDPIAETYPTQK